MVWGLPDLFKQHPPRVWGLPALSKRHPTKTWRPMVATTGAEWLGRPLSNPLRQVWATTLKNQKFIQNSHGPPVAGFCLFKRDPPRMLPRLNETLRGFRGWPVATPRAEGGRGEVNLPPYKSSDTPDRGSADIASFLQSAKYRRSGFLFMCTQNSQLQEPPRPLMAHMRLKLASAVSLDDLPHGGVEL